MIHAELQETESETLLVITAVASKDHSQVPPVEIPNFVIHIEDSWKDNDFITASLTDIKTRSFAQDQIKLETDGNYSPAHLDVEKTKKIEAANAAVQSHATEVIIAASEHKPKGTLKVLNSKTGEAIEVANEIELTDALCDFVKPLKMKTMCKIEADITFAEPLEALELDSYVPHFQSFEKSIQLGLTDMAGDSTQRIVIAFPKSQKPIQFDYTYEDLTLGRKVRGGSSLLS